uniref:RNA polymerase subunit F n=1 Tax=Amorphochlora amoebiformis TaxID=1561963 RepID=A0A0H5BIJ2_9EUKA|nr:RNA polymerase subunit F [Amorphochlora amoebiformis]
MMKLASFNIYNSFTPLTLICAFFNILIDFITLKSRKKIVILENSQFVYYLKIFGSTLYSRFSKDNDLDIIQLYPWYFSTTRFNLRKFQLQKKIIYSYFIKFGLPIFIRDSMFPLIQYKFFDIDVDLQMIRASYYMLYFNNNSLEFNTQVINKFNTIKKYKLNSLRTTNTVVKMIPNNFVYKKSLNLIKKVLKKFGIYKSVSLFILLAKSSRYLETSFPLFSILSCIRYILLKSIKEFFFIKTLAINYDEDILKNSLRKSRKLLPIYTFNTNYFNTSHNLRSKNFIKNVLIMHLMKNIPNYEVFKIIKLRKFHSYYYFKKLEIFLPISECTVMTRRRFVLIKRIKKIMNTVNFLSNLQGKLILKTIKFHLFQNNIIVFNMDFKSIVNLKYKLTIQNLIGFIGILNCNLNLKLKAISFTPIKLKISNWRFVQLNKLFL